MNKRENILQVLAIVLCILGVTSLSITAEDVTSETLVDATTDSTTGRNPYCDVNITTVYFIPVTKMKTVLKKPKGLLSIFKSKKTSTVEYVEQERHVKWKLVRGCCEGHRLTEMGLCEPECRPSCPQHASCVEPNRCQCRDGYALRLDPETGAHHCEPKCSEGCPEHAHCSEPQVCRCAPGYRLQQQQCVALCGLGSADENCLDESTAYATDSSVTTSSKLPAGDSSEPTTDRSTTANCAEDYVLLDGECKPSIFDNVELSCRLQSCPANAVCAENFFCACMGEFRWFKVNSTSSLQCVNAIVARRLDEDVVAIASRGDIGVASDDDDASNDGDNDWLDMVVIGLGALCMLSALLFLTVYLLRRQRGSMDVEAKNELRCEYDNKCYADSQLVY